MVCREVRKLIQTMPKGGCEETLRLVSEHLSECEGCRDFHAGLRKMEELLDGRKLRLDEIARHSPISKSRILEGIAPPRMLGVLASWREKKARKGPLAKAQRRKAWPRTQASLPPITSTYAPLSTKRRWRLRPVWAGAMAILLVAIAGAAALLLRERGTGPKVTVVHDTPTPLITRAMAAAASDRTLRNLAEVAQRYEAPPPKLLSGSPPSPRGPAVPRLLEKCLLESEKTLRAIAQSKTNLTWRNES